MVERDHGLEAAPRVQRHRLHPQAGQPRRRLQFGTGYAHRGPAPASQPRPRGDQPDPSRGTADGIGQQHKQGRLRVLMPKPGNGARAAAERASPHGPSAGAGTA